MIEVEKKFLLSGKDEERLLQGAEFVAEKILADVYYDTADWALTRSDRWLRTRNGWFELKMPVAPLHEERVTNQYEEWEDEALIKKALEFAEEGLLAEILPRRGHAPFAVITTTRREYKKEGFTIDLNVFDYGYGLAEIELLVPAAGERAAAEKKILAFAERHGLGSEKVRGNVIEYLRRNSPEHFHALEAAWKKKL